MSTNKNITDMTDDEFKELLKPDYGIITDGFCSTPESQEEFDKNQKGKAPIEYYE